MEKLLHFFLTQIVAPKIRTEFVFLDILTKPNVFIIYSSVILTLLGIPMMEPFNGFSMSVILSGFFTNAFP